MTDFNRAIALQATPDQIAQFQQLNKSTEAASKQAQNLIQPSENATRPNSSRYADLSDAVGRGTDQHPAICWEFFCRAAVGIKASDQEAQ